jgi:hypothetical protein
VLKADDLTTLIVPNLKKILNLNLPDPHGPMQACSGIALPLTVAYTYIFTPLGKVNPITPTNAGQHVKTET